MNDQLALTCAARNKRPARTETMRRQAAEKLIAEMVERGLVNAADAADSVGDIVRATRWETQDGYKIARELEQSCSWDCDMQIAEALESFADTLDSIYDAAEKQWAAENPSDPAFADGMAVVWRGQPATVHGLYDYRPQCYRVRQGDMGKPTSFYIVPFEDVTAP